MKIRKLLILMLLFPIAGFNQIYEKEKDWQELRFEQREFEKAYKAAIGNSQTPSILYKLGMMYQAGYGVEVDIEEAIKLYKKAANSGNEHAMFTLGLIYERGLHDGLQNYEEIDARSRETRGYSTTTYWYFQRAITSDHRNYDYLNYAIMTEERFKSVNPDFKEAYKWYLLALKTNKTLFGPRFRLGTMHYFGLGVQQNNTIAFNYFLEEGVLSDSNNVKGLKTFLGWHIRSVAQYNLASMYFKGEGTEQNYKEALRWYSESSNLKVAKNVAGNYFGRYQIAYMPAIYQMGKFYYHGLGVPQNYKKAVEYLSISSSMPSKSIDSSRTLPEIRVTKNKEITIFGERKKAMINSMVLLAHIHRNGYGVKKNNKNNKQALGWNYYAALSGHSQSIAILETLGLQVPLKKTIKITQYEDVLKVHSLIPENYDNLYKSKVNSNNNVMGKNIVLDNIENTQLIQNAKKGSIESQIELARNYFDSENDKRDLVAGYAWLTIAADNGSLEAIRYRNAYQNRLSESQRLMAFEFARNVILSGNKKSKRKYEISERDRIEEEKKVVLAQLEIQKNTAINLVETEFEIKKEEELKKIEDAAKEREQQVEKLSQENISTKDDESDDLGKALNKIENLYKKSLITSEERRLMRNKALGLN